MLEINMPIQIETERLFLKKHSLENTEIMFKAVDLNRKRLGVFMPWVPLTQSIKDIENYINKSHKQWDKSEVYDFSLFTKEENKYLGNIGLHAIALEHHRGEIGYWISKEAEGKGLMSEAVEALEKECFKMGFNRIEIRCAPENSKSQNIPKRLKYEFEGVFKKNHIVNGVYQDTMIFAKLNQL